MYRNCLPLAAVLWTTVAWPQPAGGPPPPQGPAHPPPPPPVGQPARSAAPANEPVVYAPPPNPYASSAHAEAEPDDAGVAVPGFHLHDGLFVRLAGGVSYLTMKLDPETEEVSAATIRGGGIGWQFDFGWALVDGVVLGVGYEGAAGLNTAVDGSDSIGNPSAVLLLLGPFVSVFPDPRENLEVGASLAYSAFSFSYDETAFGGDRHNERLDGWGGAAWAGYGDWISANWAIGGMLRVTFSQHSDTASVETASGPIFYDEGGTAWSISAFFNPVFQ